MASLANVFSSMVANKLKTWLAFFAASIAFFGLNDSRAAEKPEEMRGPASVIRPYLRAVYARDFAEAYRYISSEDHRVQKSQSVPAPTRPIEWFCTGNSQNARRHDRNRNFYNPSCGFPNFANRSVQRA
jgi:hypothetical protein